MNAIEFQTQIHNGNITIPKAYQHEMSGVVRVIILAQKHSSAPNLIDNLLDNPLIMPDFTPLTREQTYDRS